MSSLSQAATAAEKRTNARYWIVVMLFIVTSFNYGDRATLSIAGSEMAGISALIRWGWGMCSPPSHGLMSSARSGRLAARPLRLEARLFLVDLHLVDVYPAAGLRRYLQRLWHYRCAVYPALPRRPCRVAVIPRQQQDRRRPVPGAGEGTAVSILTPPSTLPPLFSRRSWAG